MKLSGRIVLIWVVLGAFILTACGQCTSSTDCCTDCHRDSCPNLHDCSNSYCDSPPGANRDSTTRADSYRDSATDGYCFARTGNKISR